jgi:hypothetical protein
MTSEEFLERVREGGTIPLSVSEWEGISPVFPEVERHRTQLAGDLIIIEVDGLLVAVESPSREARVARPLGSLEAVRDFVDKRMEEYERMWDGCGVKIDYLGPDP